MELQSEYKTSLPIMKPVALRLLALREDDLDVSFKTLEELVKLDPSLAGTIIKVANSARYGTGVEITNLERAIARIGFRTVKNFALITSFSTNFNKVRKDDFYFTFWDSSIRLAFIARDLASRVFKLPNADEAFLAGMLSGLGKLAMYIVHGAEYEEILQQTLQVPDLLRNAEQQKFNTTHQQVSELILEHWEVPDVFSEVSGEILQQDFSSRFKMISLAVSIAELASLSNLYGPEHYDELFNRYCRMSGQYKSVLLEQIDRTVEKELLNGSLYSDIRRAFLLT